jgi:DNA-binding transcriptional MocR family regulator
MRFDSFSKVLAGGLRLGYVTAPTALLRPIEVLTASVILHASALSQMFAFKILEHWGTDGFLRHALTCARFYADRRERFVRLAHQHLDGYATWEEPSVGLFVWIDCSPSGVVDSVAFTLEHCIPLNVLPCPGSP